MGVELLSFNNFTFPYNPERIEIEYDKTLKLVTMPFAKPVTQEVGQRPRVVRGQGEWPKGGADTLARQLEQEFARTGPGRLICPITGPMNAYFTALKLVGKGGRCSLAYAFEFVEDVNGAALGLKSGARPPADTVAFLPGVGE